MARVRGRGLAFREEGAIQSRRERGIANGSPVTGSSLTTSAARRGIYLDVQGVRGSPPVVLGLLVDGHFDQVILDSDFADAALAKELRITSEMDEVQSLLQRVRQEERLVFGFSLRWQELTGATDDQGPPSQMLPLIVDGQQLAADWYRSRGRVRSARMGLGDFLRAVGVPAPAGLDSKATSKRLRDVRAMMQARGYYDALTPVGKGKWTKLLKQNQERCEGLQALILALMD